jgi:catechol 2,3-dioxygenase-like lactoylglutathione lyase family enzyme
MKIDGLHHVALPCADLGRSRRFYQDILGLTEIPRPTLPVAGAWFRVGDRQELHLVVGDPQATFRITRGWIPTTSTSPFGLAATDGLWKRSEPRVTARTRTLMT